VSGRSSIEPVETSRATFSSQTSGVAPLAVFFDAVHAEMVPKPPEVNGRQEFADQYYEWEFGDENAGTWAINGRSKNVAAGYVATHVYEQPGTYTVTLAVTDVDGNRTGYSETITVEDPDVVYAGANTICFSTASSFDGCPADATHRTTDDISTISEFYASGRRVLLRRGDSWTTDAVTTIRDVSGPFTLGAFGPCDNPDVRGICSNAPNINVTNGGQSDPIDEPVIAVMNSSDIRLMDIELTGEAARWTALDGGTGIDRLLNLRLRVTGFTTPMGSGHWDTRGHDQYMLVDSDVGGGASNGVYTGSERLAILGNRIADSQDSHVVRVWQGYLADIGHNSLSGSSLSSDSGRHALMMHGPMEEEIADTGPAGLDHRTRFVIIHDNTFGGSGPWPVYIGPQNGETDERLRDIVLERNRFLPDYGTQSCCSSPQGTAMKIIASGVTIRNNVISGVASAQYYVAIDVSNLAIEPPPEDVRILNNTVVKSSHSVDEYTEYTGFSVNETVTRATIMNNLVHFDPDGDFVELVVDLGMDSRVSSNLLTDDPQLVDPDNPDPLSRDFGLRPGSPAVGAGEVVPVFDDYTGDPRPRGGPYDLGALQH